MDVGINLTMKEQASTVAPKVSQALRGVSDAADEMKESLDLKEIQNQYDRFAGRIKQMKEEQRARPGATAPGGVPGGGKVADLDEERKKRKGIDLSKIRDVARLAGRVGQRVGGGDMMGASEDVADTASKMMGTMGTIGAILASVAGVAFAINAISEQYQKQIPILAALNAQMGSGPTGFLDKMKDLSKIASKFGNSLEEAMAAGKGLTEVSGSTKERTMEDLRKILNYGRGLGVDPQTLARAQGLSTRFGMEGNPLGLMLGGLQESKMGRGLFKEFLSSTLSIFEEGLSKGVTRGFKDIVTTQAWMAQGGPLFQGQYGLQRFRKMEQGMAGATELKSENDVIMYRSMRRYMESMSPEQRKKAGYGDPRDFRNVMEALQMGPTAGFMKSLHKDVSTMTGGNEVDIYMLMKSLNNLGYAEMNKFSKVLKSPVKNVGEVAAGGEAYMQTEEFRSLSAKEQASMMMREAGKKLLPLKVGAQETILQAMKDITEGKTFNENFIKGAREFFKGTADFTLGVGNFSKTVDALGNFLGIKKKIIVKPKK